MRVVVLGGESTGGRLVARLLGADAGLAVEHYSMPHGGGAARHWPTDCELADAAPAAVLVTIRAWVPMVASKAAHHVPNMAHAEREAAEAYERIFAWLHSSGHRWRWLVYEALVARPEATMAGVWRWLGRPVLPPTELIEDGDAKW